MARIELIGVSKTLADGERRGATFRIEDLSLTIPDGRTLVILGPSGCGKTTLLKIIAGLITPDAGRVRYDGVDVREAAPGDRRIGIVFQNYALYPHLTSRSNVLSYFLFRKKTPEMDALKKAKFQRTSELMGVELAHLLDRKPPTLSGGEKQRVAVARCITRDPALFLLDEPFSNLDQALREKYRVSLKLLLRQFGITTVYVTHDHYEALILADLLAIMDHGRIEQIGTCSEIYDEPRNLFVAGFLNRHVGTPPLSVLDARDVAQCRELGDLRIGVRPEDVEISRHPRADGTRGIVAARVDLPLINATIAEIRIGAHEVHAQAAVGEPFRAGDQVWLTFTRYHVFDETGARLTNLSSTA
jgi:ABC-type sugar transport system ATPase subunit